MNEVAAVAAYLLAPLTLVFLVALLACGLAASGRRRASWVTAMAGYAALWIAAMPATAAWLTGELESRHPPQPVQAIPKADAIVVLGGALQGAYPPLRPSFVATPAATRVWHAAALYHGGKAPVIIVAAGNRSPAAGLQPEAEAIGEMLRGLGVPPTALRLEGRSRTTRENAAHALSHVRALNAGTVLLVTSASHMDRALKTFEVIWEGTGVRVIPAATDYRVTRDASAAELWFPTASALANVTSAIKEFAGTLALAIM